MTEALSNIFLSTNSRKILTYYGGYCCLFLLAYLSLVSTVSFFHFLLDHNMSVIEAWLSQNAWEVLGIAKLLAATLGLAALKLNNYQSLSFREVLKRSRFVPGRQAAAFSLFVICFFAALTRQFEGEFAYNAESGRLASSFLGSCAFYLFDIFFIRSAVANFPISRSRQAFMLSAALPCAFFFSSKLALPYMGNGEIFLFLNFFSLSLFLMKEKTNLGNSLLYSLVVIGPLSAIFGTDLVWGDKYSKLVYSTNAPLFGVFLIWLTGFLYYLRPNRPA